MVEKASRVAYHSMELSQMAPSGKVALAVMRLMVVLVAAGQVAGVGGLAVAVASVTHEGVVVMSF